MISADLGRLAQMRPGARLRFSAVSVSEAVSAWRTARADMQRMAASARAEGAISTEELLAQNLIGGVVSADE